MKKITGTNIISDGQQLWIWNANAKCLHNINLDNVNSIFCTEDNSCSIWGIGVMALYKDLIIIFPGNGDKIAIYNKKTDCWKYILLPNEFLEIHSYVSGMIKFAYAYVYGNRIYAFGANYPGIVVLYPELDVVRYISLCDVLRGKVKNLNKGYFSRSAAALDQCLYLVIRETNYLFRFDFENETHKLIRIQEENEYDGICALNERIWLMRSDRPEIIMLDDGFHALTKIRFKVNNDDYLWPDIRPNGKYILIYTVTHLIVVNTEDNSVDVRVYNEIQKKTYDVHVRDNIVYELYEGKIGIREMNGRDENYRIIDIELPEITVCQLLRAGLQRENNQNILIQENLLWGFQEYIDVICLKENSMVDGKNIGNDIYAMIYRNWLEGNTNL